MRRHSQFRGPVQLSLLTPNRREQKQPGQKLACDGDPANISEHQAIQESEPNHDDEEG